MRTLAVDRDNDIFVGASGSLAMALDLQAVMQACAHALKGIAGEMAFNAGRGLPYFEAVWTGSPNLRVFEDAARQTLAGIEGVTGVPAFDCSVEGNILAYRATISTVYGHGLLTGDMAHGL